MALGRGRRNERTIDYWPGFVDALSTLLLAIIFLLSIFMLAQYFLSREVTGKDQVLDRLNNQIAQLTELLALERADKRNLNETIASLTASLTAAEQERDKLKGLVDGTAIAAQTAGTKLTEVEKVLDAEKRTSRDALAQVELLNQQIAALRRQLAAIESALGASETRDKDAQAKIADLGRRLNVALAQKVQELSRYRSDFFGRLREILGNRPDIRVVGDRFVFQSELFFDPGQSTLKVEGREGLDKLATALAELEKQIPNDIAWVIRVDGHTDNRPIATAQFPSNWELSSARAISVVQFLMSKGIQPQHLVAAGFGEFQPLEPGDGDDNRRRNRRIELKLTER